MVMTPKVNQYGLNLLPMKTRKLAGMTYQRSGSITTVIVTEIQRASKTIKTNGTTPWKDDSDIAISFIKT